MLTFTMANNIMQSVLRLLIETQKQKGVIWITGELSIENWIQVNICFLENYYLFISKPQTFYGTVIRLFSLNRNGASSKM